MVKKLSDAMIKTLDEIKKEMKENFDRGNFNLKIVRGATKNKELRAIAPVTGATVFQLFVNEKFYATYFYERGKDQWVERFNEF